MQKRRSLFFLSDLCKQKWLTHHQSNKKKKKKTGLELPITRYLFLHAQANTNTKPRIMSFRPEILRPTRTLIYPPSLGLSFREAGHSGGVGERDLQQGA